MNKGTYFSGKIRHFCWYKNFRGNFLPCFFDCGLMDNTLNDTLSQNSNPAFFYILLAIVNTIIVVVVIIIIICIMMMFMCFYTVHLLS